MTSSVILDDATEECSIRSALYTYLHHLNLDHVGETMHIRSWDEGRSETLSGYRGGLFGVYGKRKQPI